MGVYRTAMRNKPSRSVFRPQAAPHSPRTPRPGGAPLLRRPTRREHWAGAAAGYGPGLQVPCMGGDARVWVVQFDDLEARPGARARARPVWAGAVPRARMAGGDTSSAHPAGAASRQWQSSTSAGRRRVHGARANACSGCPGQGAGRVGPPPGAPPYRAPCGLRQQHRWGGARGLLRRLAARRAGCAAARLSLGGGGKLDRQAAAWASLAGSGVAPLPVSVLR